MKTSAYYIGKYRRTRVTKRKRKIKKYRHCVIREIFRSMYGVSHCPRKRCGKKLYAKICNASYVTPF